jgi:hypothetical protein
MFLKNSRYFGLPTHTVTDGKGRPVSLLAPRVLPATTGDDVVVAPHDQLDAMAEKSYRDATRYWHIADANTALRAGELTEPPGTTIQRPRS